MYDWFYLSVSLCCGGEMANALYTVKASHEVRTLFQGGLTPVRSGECSLFRIVPASVSRNPLLFFSIPFFIESVKELFHITVPFHSHSPCCFSVHQVLEQKQLFIKVIDRRSGAVFIILE